MIGLTQLIEGQTSVIQRQTNKHTHTKGERDRYRDYSLFSRILRKGSSSAGLGLSRELISIVKITLAIKQQSEVAAYYSMKRP